MIPRGYKPTSRDELVVPKAVLPKKGMVRLLAHGKAEESMTDADKAGEGKKGHRPAPHSFRKLQEKQKGVMQRAGSDRKEVTTLKSILAELELPERSPQSSSLPARETVHSNTPVAGTTGKFPLAHQQYSSTQRVMRDAKRQLKHGDAVSGRLTVIFSR
ncbi:uncharacterized protein [Diadema antillarum]|uniref:uncharacterized protein n=1 Tax=Diadema antillarum TaxID=105358 RepID=UPI003A86A018